MNDPQIQTALPRFPSRFSLRRLLVVVTFVGLILGLVASRRQQAIERLFHESEIKTVQEAHKRENLKLRRRVAQMEDIAGWPSDRDRTHVAAGVAHVGVLDAWLCHLQQPPKRNLVLHYAVADIPDAGLPPPQGTVHLLSGTEIHGAPITYRTIAISIAEIRDGERTQHRLRIYADSIRFEELEIPDSHFLHRMRTAEAEFTSTATYTIVPLNPTSDTPLVLLKIVEEPRKGTEGLMVWIDEYKKDVAEISP